MAIVGAGSTRDTGRRLLVTMGALFLYRLGCQIPLAGVDLSFLIGTPGVPDSAFSHLSIFALGVMPIFTATMIFEIAKLAFPALGRRAHPRRAILIGALALAALDGFAIARALEHREGIVIEPGWAFRLETIATLVAGTALLGWLAERITRHGLGDGLWLLLVAPFLVQLPRTAVFAFELSRMDAASPSITSVPVGYCLLAGALIIPLALTRYAPISFSTGGEHSERGAICPSFMDVWPPLLAQSVGAFLISTLLLATGQMLNAPSLAVGAPLHLVIIAALIAGFAYLRAPRGRAAAQPAILAALVQIAICGVGELLSLNFGIPFRIDGAWLIVVVVTLTRVATRIVGRRAQ
jgi:preprotein translocase subunit SecY